MEWLYDRISGFEGVTHADIQAEGSGPARLVIHLGAREAPGERGPMDSLLNANLAPMLAYDTETLSVVKPSGKATDIFGFRGHEVLTIKQYFRPIL